ncbi:MAG: succinylglutamate desuccinylase/aspartoacylase family protein [Bacteroidia bacterium]|nr:succinylglutamate desuccinylase/aspartoacylase family protein [Bacteroidia bacterium]
MRESRFEIPVFENTLEVSRYLGDVGNQEGNTVLFIGGVHGNETAGVGALNRVFEQLNQGDIDLTGRAVALIGNMEATRLGKRYVDKDLNRIWTREVLDDLHYDRLDNQHSEYHELREVYNELQTILAQTKGRLFVIDLHTTSSPTIPFIVTNKTNSAMEFTKRFPMPVVSGLMGFLDGTLLSYINDLGHVGLAYEAGQHKSPQSMIKHESFVWQCLYYAGVCKNLTDDFLQHHASILEEELVTRTNNFKLISRYKIKNGEAFEMNPGYANFQKIYKGEELAMNQDGPICSPYDGYVFMPLYQPLGDDGFFIIKPEAT